jgi:hypothetical protein
MMEIDVNNQLCPLDPDNFLGRRKTEAIPRLVLFYQYTVDTVCHLLSTGGYCNPRSEKQEMKHTRLLGNPQGSGFSRMQRDKGARTVVSKLNAMGSKNHLPLTLFDFPLSSS